MEFDEAKVLQSLNDAWGWALENAVSVLAVNEMGNCLVRDHRGQFWRICPEELFAKVVATNEEELRAMQADPVSKKDWQLRGFMGPAEKQLGPLSVGQCYGMTTPAGIGGEYVVSNLKIRPLYEYLAATGSMAFQIKDLEDGDEVTLQVTQ